MMELITRYPSLSVCADDIGKTVKILANAFENGRS